MRSMLCSPCAEQISEFEFILPRIFGSTITTIDQLCAFLEAEAESDRSATIEGIGDTLTGLPHPVNLTTALIIQNCLEISL
jgi:hypothetical protein